MPFQFRVNTQNLSDFSPSGVYFILPLKVGHPYALNIDWGDGDFSSFDQISTPLFRLRHDYNVHGEYLISINGTVDKFSFSHARTEVKKITEILDWGNLSLDPDLNLPHGHFQNCENLETIPPSILDALDVSNLTSLKNSFSYCSSLRYVVIKGLQNITSLEQTFEGCREMTSFVFPNFSLGNCINFRQAWKDCETMFDFPRIDTSKGINFERAWENCDALSVIPELNFESATTLFYAWNGCINLTAFNGVNTGNVINAENAWRNTSIVNFPLIDLSSCTNIRGAWSGISRLETFPIIDVSNVTDASGAWIFCRRLNIFPKLNFTNCNNFNNSWRGCENLEFDEEMWDVINDFEDSDPLVFTDVFTNTFLTSRQYDLFLKGIHDGNTTSKTRIHVDAPESYYTSTGEAYRNVLINDFNWTFNDLGLKALIQPHFINLNFQFEGKCFVSLASFKEGTLRFSLGSDFYTFVSFDFKPNFKLNIKQRQDVEPDAVFNLMATGGVKSVATVGSSKNIIVESKNNLKLSSTSVFEISVTRTIRLHLSKTSARINVKINPSMNNGIILQGNSKINFNDFVISTLRVSTKTKSRIERLTFYKKYKGSYCLAMKSMNICKLKEYNEKERIREQKFLG